MKILLHKITLILLVGGALVLWSTPDLGQSNTPILLQPVDRAWLIYDYLEIKVLLTYLSFIKPSIELKYRESPKIILVPDFSKNLFYCYLDTRNQDVFNDLSEALKSTLEFHRDFLRDKGFTGKINMIDIRFVMGSINNEDDSNGSVSIGKPIPIEDRNESKILSIEELIPQWDSYIGREVTINTPVEGFVLDNEILFVYNETEFVKFAFPLRDMLSLKSLADETSFISYPLTISGKISPKLNNSYKLINCKIINP